MKTILAIVAIFSGVVFGGVTVKPSCPTITSKDPLCTSCRVPACLTVSTVTASCGPIPTETIAYPCGGPCPSGCFTSYVVEQPTPTGNPGCPTVTSEGTICPTSTCIRPACLKLSTVTASCGPVPTTTVNYPCGGPCPVGCGTTYVVVQPTDGPGCPAP